MSELSWLVGAASGGFMKFHHMMFEVALGAAQFPHSLQGNP